MKTYEVTVPICGVAYATVEADSPEAAIEKALSITCLEDVCEWTALPEIVTGNVFRGIVNRASAEEEPA